MLPTFILGSLIVVGIICTTDPRGGMGDNGSQPKGEGGTIENAPNRDFGTRNTSFEGMKHQYLRDFHDAGIHWGINRPTLLNVTNLNEAWKPYSAPSQTETRSLFELYKNESDKSAYLGEYAHPFYFMKNGEIPLATPEQSNPNVELPCRYTSFKGDPGGSLMHYPRVYYDYSCGVDNPHIFSENSKRVWNAGQPTESEVVHVPREGMVNREFNPWGPGGVLQRIFNVRNERETRRRGVDLARRAVPPPSTYFNTKYT
jgi:hypothetical protein